MVLLAALFRVLTRLPRLILLGFNTYMRYLMVFLRIRGFRFLLLFIAIGFAYTGLVQA